MKVRKLAVALALAGTLGAEMAHAVGLGQIKLESYLNQPLKAQINLLDAGNLSPDQIIVGLASNQDFSKAGIKRTYNLSNLKFKVVRGANGNVVVNVTTDKPVHEPFIDFLVDLNWPSGRVMREYTLLVDPPTYEKKEQAPSVSTAGSSSPASAQQQTAGGSQGQSVTVQPAAGAESAGSAPANTGGGTYGPTKASDTLWGIAEKMKPSSRVTTQQEMLAIRDQNPDAFIGGNINRMKRGHVLRLPTLSQVQSRSRRQAVREVIAQNKAFNAMRQASQHPPVNATAQGNTATGSRQVARSGDQLKLVVDSQDKETKNGSHGGGNGGTSETSLRNKLSVTQEQVDKLQRDNTDLNARLKDLQDQVKTLKRLVQLKSDQLTALQVQAAQQGNATSTQEGETAAAGMTSSPAASASTTTSAPESNSPTAGAVTSAPGNAAEASQTSEANGMAGARTSEPTAEVTAKTSLVAAAPAESTQSGTAAPVKPSTGQQESAASNSASETPATPAVPPEQKQTSFMDDIIHKLLTNRMYQLGAGGAGILVLIALWLLARRNAHHEKRFYENLRDGDEGEPVELGDSKEESETDGMGVGGEAGEQDPLSEADVYIAYGRFDQATHLLEEAISAEPSRSDLRLKLLEAYAESRNRDAFEKQFRELEALGEESSLASAEGLRERLNEAEDVPSISDLESELKAGVQRDAGATDTGEAEDSFAGFAAEGEAQADEDLGVEWNLDDADAGVAEAEPSAELSEPEIEASSGEEAAVDEGSIDFDLGDLDLEPEESAGAADTSEDDLDMAGLSEELERSLEEDTENAGDDNSIDFALDADEGDALDLDADEDSGTAPLDGESGDDDLSLEEDLASIEFDPEEVASEDASAAVELDETAEASADSPIDESFLDELDAELDKVTAGDEQSADVVGSTDMEAEADTAALELTDESGADAESLEADPLSGAEQDQEEDLLGDLELDVSDEDLAILEEASQTEESEVPELDDSVAAADGDLGAAAGESADEVPDLSADQELLDIDLDENEDALTEEGEVLPEGEWDDLELTDGDLDLSESDLDLGGAESAGGEEVGAEKALNDLGTEPEDEDFDFLAGTDEAATKLDLARAYIEMGDSDGAKDILEEVAIEGSDDQKKEAQDLLKSIS